MKQLTLKSIQQYRETYMEGFMPIPPDMRQKKEKWGVFMIPLGELETAIVIADNGVSSPEWEHVSVSLPTRCPTWDEMCKIKEIFFSDDETVVQYHPRKQDYVNIHRFCLHLWRLKNGTFPVPPKELVV